MPLDRLYSSRRAIWGIWSIGETEGQLASIVPGDKVPEGLTNPMKRLEFLAGRTLVKALLSKWGEPYTGLRKDQFGKPFLAGSTVHVSLSHSYPHVAAILHRSNNVGIDLEQPKEKLLRIAPRILSTEELMDAGRNIEKHCVYWCAKEALIKIYGKKDLTLSANLRIAPFAHEASGHLVGRILAKDTETTIPLDYHIFENFVVVVSAD